MKGSTKQSTQARHIGVIPAKAGIQYAAATQLIISASGILDHPLSRMVTTECVATDFQTAENSQLKPSLRANGSRECAPDDRLHEAIHLTKKEVWIASL